MLPDLEAVVVCKVWGIRWPFASPARNDAKSPTYLCYKITLGHQISNLDHKAVAPPG